MLTSEYDILEIPEDYKKMSLAEIEKKETEMLKQILSQDRPKKVSKPNKKGIVFNY